MVFHCPLPSASNSNLLAWQARSWMAWLFTHYLHTFYTLSQGYSWPFAFFNALCHIQLDVVARTCPCLLLVLSDPLFLMIFYLPFKVILALSKPKKVWCLLFPISSLSRSFSSVPPWYPVFVLIALFHNYSFMYFFLCKTEKPFGIFISSYLFLYF